MMRLLSLKHLRRSGFWGDRAGMAATEFAIIAPIMLILFFGVVEASDALTAGRRLTLATNTLADLVAQDTQITHADLDALIVGMEKIANASDSATTFTVVSVSYNPSTDRIEADWSRNDDGSTPYPAGTPYTNLTDATLLDDATSVIVTEVTYNYTPSLTDFVIPPITMERQATRWPRRAAQVKLCASAGSCP